MEISRRLEKVVGMISCKSLADIGTDHAYIPIYAKYLGKIEWAIAIDVCNGPLQKAAEHIARHGYGGVIETRLGDGLAPLKLFEADCISIAGMGGMLVIEILQNSPEIVQGTKQLVLQPQRDIPAVRRYIHSIGFRIVEEEMLFEGKYYNVLNCMPGGDASYTEREYLLGKLLLEKKDSVLHSFILERRRKLENVIKFIEIGDRNKSADGRKNEIMREIQLYEEVINNVFA